MMRICLFCVFLLCGGLQAMFSQQDIGTEYSREQLTELQSGITPFVSDESIEKKRERLKGIYKDAWNGAGKLEYEWKCEERREPPMSFDLIIRRLLWGEVSGVSGMYQAPEIWRDNPIYREIMDYHDNEYWSIPLGDAKAEDAFFEKLTFIVLGYRLPTNDQLDRVIQSSRSAAFTDGVIILTPCLETCLNACFMETQAMRQTMPAAATHMSKSHTRCQSLTGGSGGK